MQHLASCHVNEVCRIRYITQLYSIIGDANAVKEIVLLTYEHHTFPKTRTTGILSGYGKRKNGAIKSLFLCMCRCLCMCVYARTRKALQDDLYPLRYEVKRV